MLSSSGRVEQDQLVMRRGQGAGALTQALALDHHHLGFLLVGRAAAPQALLRIEDFGSEPLSPFASGQFPANPAEPDRPFEEIFGGRPQETAAPVPFCRQLPAAAPLTSPPRLCRARKELPMHLSRFRPPSPPARRRDRRPLRRRRLGRQHRPRRLRFGHLCLRRSQRAGPGRHEPVQRQQAAASLNSAIDSAAQYDRPCRRLRHPGRSPGTHHRRRHQGVRHRGRRRPHRVRRPDRGRTAGRQHQHPQPGQRHAGRPQRGRADHSRGRRRHHRRRVRGGGRQQRRQPSAPR